VNNRRTLWLAGAAAWGLCALAAAETSIYFDDFDSGTLATRTQWSFDEVLSGSPVLLSTTPDPPLSPTRFLAEFGGNDVIHLSLDLPHDTVSVRLRFDAYLLRTWDGSGTDFSGPDVFAYGVGGQNPGMSPSFSNGAGVQTYCPFSPTPTCEPTWGSDALLKNKLGFTVELDPAEGSTVPAKGTPMSLVYHFDSGPIPYSSGAITFDFFSDGLQVHDDLPNKVIDESWGLDNVLVTAQVVPEPQTLALLLAGLVLLSFAAQRRRRRR
jgi:PEP-CTERM motif